MQITCSCGCELDIQRINLDCVYDMVVYVTLCEGCDAEASGRHDEQGTRADELADEVYALKEEIAALEASIEETKYQMGER